MNLREAAEIALEALDGEAFGEYRRKVVEQLRQALAQPEQEPERIVPPVPDYAFDWCNFKKVDLMEGKQEPVAQWYEGYNKGFDAGVALTTQKHKWVGLTEDEFEKVLEQNNEAFPFAVYQQLEAKLKEKNG